MRIQLSRLLRTFFFAARFSWRQLYFEPMKLFAAALGVTFATVLVFMQEGFRDSLLDSSATMVRNLKGDLFLLHKQTEAFWRTLPFARSSLKRVYGHPHVKSVTPMYLAQGRWRNPSNLAIRTLKVVGIDPWSQGLCAQTVSRYQSQLNVDNTALFDLHSRPEFGPIPQLLDMAKGQGIHSDIERHRIHIIGGFFMGASFADDGHVLTSIRTFMNIFPRRNANFIDAGLIELHPGYNPERVKSELSPLLHPSVRLISLREIIEEEKNYWKKRTPIGFIFSMGVVLGLVVGMIIVYQILFTDIANHLSEYATLKAMGYSQRYLMLVVLSSSIFLSLFGFIPGAVISGILYRIAENAMFIPIPMTIFRFLSVFSLIVMMCFVSGMLAIRKLKSANPAEMF